MLENDFRYPKQAEKSWKINKKVVNNPSFVLRLP